MGRLYIFDKCLVFHCPSTEIQVQVHYTEVDHVHKGKSLEDKIKKKIVVVTAAGTVLTFKKLKQRDRTFELIHKLCQKLTIPEGSLISLSKVEQEDGEGEEETKDTTVRNGEERQDESAAIAEDETTQNADGADVLDDFTNLREPTD